MEDTSRDNWIDADYRREVRPIAGEIEKPNRAATARDLCTWANDQIAREAPIGLSSWPRTWLIVSEASADFLETLSLWEATGDGDDLVAFYEIAMDLLESWDHAACEFERHFE